MIAGNTDPVSPERWHQISEIFADCLEHGEGDARDAFLRQACADDATLLRQVRALIATEENAQAVLQPTQIARGLAAATANAADDAEHWLGRRLGAYQIVSVIARGGMGHVFKGLRADREFNKDVAIKLVRDADPNNQLIERFKAERQILASLDHPNIARLIDGGSSEEGWPFLVMEYVDGVPIAEFATRQQLNIAARLELLRKVCSAVHFAHQRLVVHRDLKPSNILVTQAGEVKLLDFGIAKMLEAVPQHGSSAPTLLAMTPAYASPEQVKGEAITTASDVYSLGVVLYELLTGHSPYKSKRTQPLALAREICETDPERPSTVVARIEVADVQSPTPVLDPHTLKRLRRGLRGDLDNIVLMALRKDPARRYASAEQFSEDVRRYLENLPVSARTDTFAYRASKYVTRNRWAVGFAALATLGLIGGIVATTLQAKLAQAAQARAEKHFASVRKLANSYLFDVHDAIRDLPGATPAREMLVKNSLTYLDQLSTETDDVSLGTEIATGYDKLADVQGAWRTASLGDTAGAEASFRKAIALRERVIAERPQDKDIRRVLISSHGKLAELLMSLGKRDEALQESERALQASLVLAQSRDATALDKLNVARARFSLATQHIVMSGGDAGKQELDQALTDLAALVKQTPGDIRLTRAVVSAYTRAAIVDLKGDHFAAAITRLTEATRLNEQNRAAEPANPQYQRTFALLKTQFAEARWRHGEIGIDATLGEQRESLDAMRNIASDDPKNQRYAVDTAVMQQLVADKLSRSGRHDSAITMLDEVIATHKRANDNTHDATAHANWMVSQAQRAFVVSRALKEHSSINRAQLRALCDVAAAIPPTLFEHDERSKSESISEMPTLREIDVSLANGRELCRR